MQMQTWCNTEFTKLRLKTAKGDKKCEQFSILFLMQEFCQYSNIDQCEWVLFN